MRDWAVQTTDWVVQVGSTGEGLGEGLGSAGEENGWYRCGIGAVQVRGLGSTGEELGGTGEGLSSTDEGLGGIYR